MEQINTLTQIIVQTFPVNKEHILYTITHENAVAVA